MKNQIKIGAILSYVTLGVYALVSLIYTPFMVRCLGQSEYGLYSLIRTIVGYLTILDLGLSSTIIIYTSKYKSLNKNVKKLEGMFFLLYIIIGIIASILGFIIYFNINHIFGNTLSIPEINKGKILLLILIFNTVITFSFTIYSSIIIANEKFIFNKIICIIQSLLVPILMIPFLLLGHKSITMVIVITLVNLFVLLSNYIYAKKVLKVKIKYCGIDKKVLKEILIYTSFIFINVVVDKINLGIDQILIGMIYGSVNVSIYSIGSQFNIMFISLSTAIDSVILPKITKLVSNNIDVNDEFIKISRIQYIILMLMLSGFLLFGQSFIKYWAGIEYHQSYYIALILMISGIIPLTQSTGITILRAQNKHQFVAYAYIFMAVINIILSIPLINILGGLGGAIGTLLSFIISYIIIDIYYYKNNINIIKYWSNFIELTFRYSILIVIFFLVLLIDINEITKLFIFIPLYMLCYVIYTYLIIMNSYEKSLVKEIVNKIKKR